MAKPPPEPALIALNKFLNYIGGLDDRAMVLSLAAFADDSLERLLLAYLKNTKQAKELVEGFAAPLGPFAVRIKAAYAIGLLNSEQYADLSLLKDIRNRFAHDFEGVTLESNDIKAKIGQMHCHQLSPDDLPADSDAKVRLREGIRTICVELRVLLGMLQDGRKDTIPDASIRLYAGKTMVRKDGKLVEK